MSYVMNPFNNGIPQFQPEMKRNPKKSTKKMKFTPKENNINNGSSVNNEEEQKEDRLSSLPESLLLQILSLLPLQSAATTSVLSRRLRNLWTQHPHLIFDTPPFIHFTFYKFRKVVAQILKFLASTKIHTFSILYPYAQTDNQIQPWNFFFAGLIAYVCGRNPDEIKVILEFPTARYPLIEFPLCVLETSSLVTLELTGPFGCENPLNGVICLPNLKTLLFRMLHMDSDFMGKIVKSCPLLELLTLELIWSEDGIVMEISAPNLKQLNVRMTGYSEDTTFFIDAPKLEIVVLHGGFAFYNFVSKPNALTHADLGFCSSPFGGNIDCQNHLSVILQQISSVKSLHLLNNIGVLNSIDYVGVGVLESFCNLTRIEITRVSLDQLNWSCPIPDFLLCKLKVIEFVELDGDEEDLKLMKYVLDKAEVLEELHVKVTYSEGWDDGEDDSEKEEMWKELSFCKDLFMLSRPPSCVIVLTGEYVHTSSKDFQNGSMLCQLECFETTKATYQLCMSDFEPY